MSLCQTGYAADAVIVGSKIIRRESEADNNHRVGGQAANPTDQSTTIVCLCRLAYLTP